MPQDSVEIINIAPTPEIRDTVNFSVSYTEVVSTEVKQHEQAWAAFWVSVVIGAFFIIRPFVFRRSPWPLFGKLSQQVPAPQTIERYQVILEQYNPYYRRLSPKLKDRFLTRTFRFMQGKTFHYIEMSADEINERMPVLISSVAVQIAFGLRRYEMSYFKNIYVLRSNYHFGLSAIPFEGHVNSLGIYLSWSNFESAFMDYNDGNNVGLHEMAHALTYVNFTAREGEDDDFRSRFKIFSKTGRRLFAELEAGRKTMLGGYASTNYNEFWAVCIENFFERSQQMKTELPELYTELTKLLNQDPLTDNLLINNLDRA